MHNDHDHDHGHHEHEHGHDHHDHGHGHKAGKGHSHGGPRHSHGHGPLGHHHHHFDPKTTNLKVALLLNLGFSLLELIGGLWTGSVAILSDAVHDLGDALSLTLAYVFERLAKRGSTPNFSYGYRRMSLLSALITGVFLIIGSAAVLAHAIPRLANPVAPKLEGMLVFAFLGIAVNGYAAWRLMRGGGTMNERVVSWHLLEDVLGWVTVLIGTLVMMVWDVPILDPILSIAFSAFIIFNVLRNLGATVRLFLQATPKDIDLQLLRGAIDKVAGVVSNHDAHLWSLDGESHVLTVHVVTADSATLQDMERIKGEVRRLAGEHGKIHVTVELESERANCPAVSCVSET